MKTIFIFLVISMATLLNGNIVFSGDLKCYGYTSTTSYFQCGTYGNCTWWAAFMRPDLATAGISGDAKYWYGNAGDLGFNLGSKPKVGAIAVFSDFGHVAYVEGVNSDGSFSVSEMDYYGTLGTGFGVQYASYYLNSDGTYKRAGGAHKWILKGFIYRREYGTSLYCDKINSVWGICWNPSSIDVSCQGGTGWVLYDFEQGSVIRVSTNGYCLEPGGNGGAIENPSIDDPEPINPDSDPDLHINSFDLREIGGSWVKKISKALYWGQSFQVEGGMEVENRSSQEAKDVDSDYRIEDKRDFDENDTKIDEDNPFDIDPGEREEKSMIPVAITVSPDGQSVAVSRGSMKKSFPVINGFAKIYFFVDVEEDGGDHDISSESDKDEYGKVELIIRPPIIANFSANILSGNSPLAVIFSDHSTNNPTVWNWDFGDGQFSTAKNSTHIYLSPGNFTVRLTAGNSLGVDSITKFYFITVNNPSIIPVPEVPAPALIEITIAP